MNFMFVIKSENILVDLDLRRIIIIELAMVNHLYLINDIEEHNVSENCFNSFVEVMREIMPRDNIMPSDFYDMKKLAKGMQFAKFNLVEINHKNEPFVLAN